MKLYLITGFLGSGKTTCINQLLNHKTNSKVGIIVNEFGSEGIDGKFIKSYSGLEIKELNNGSIFCQCIKDDFINALCDYQNYDLDIVFIEASGLSDHSNMLSILEVVKHVTGKGYDYAGSICIIDSLYFLEQVELLLVLERQIKYSNVIIINKVELQTLEKIKEIERKIKTLNEKALIIKTSFCKFNIDAILNKVSEPNIESSDSTNTISTRPYSCVIEIKDNAKYEDVENFIKEIMFYTYRIKGFVKIDTGLYEVNCVNNSFKMEINNGDNRCKNNNFMIISKVGMKVISIIIKFAKQFNIEIDIRK